MSLRNLRKRIHHLYERGPMGNRVVLWSVLGAYKAFDKLILRRNTRIDLKSEKLFLPTLNAVCCLVPKGGSRTLLIGLRSNVGVENLDIVEKDIRQLGERLSGSFTFAFVRNPWSRVFSCYKEKVCNVSPIASARLFNGRPGISQDMSFADFVDWLCGEYGRDELADRHWVSQHLILGMDQGIHYDFVGKLEHFDRDISALCDRLDLDSAKFKHHLKRTGQAEYAKHYTSDMIDAVGRRYAGDIERFGYTFL